MSDAKKYYVDREGHVGRNIPRATFLVHEDDYAAALKRAEEAEELRETTHAQTGLIIDQGTHIAELEAKVKELKNSIANESFDIEQSLGKALGYPWYKDDPKNFPDATEESGVCVGEHVPASIAAEAARRITELEAENAEVQKDRERLDWLEINSDIRMVTEGGGIMICKHPTRQAIDAAMEGGEG
jgi:hypothetical protein